jgi:FkbM family methyltransferase
MTNQFITCLVRQILDNSYNYNIDNFDEERFWKLSRVTKLKSKIKKTFMNIFGRLGLFFIDGDFKESSARFSQIENDLVNLENTYSLLEDEYSKKMLVEVFAYKILGHRRFKLSVNNCEYAKKLNIAQSLIVGNESIEVGSMGWSLRKLDLGNIGYNLKLFYLPLGISIIFMHKQYEYNKINPAIKVKKGNYVIDAGGCWGETALYFAQEVGESGKVFTFEFIPSNLRIMERNFDLNGALKDRINIVKNPIWQHSGKKIYYTDNGPGSSVSEEKLSEKAVEISTLALDDFFLEKKLPRVDFIKMDIEGSELEALKGAEGLMKKYRPTLAISIYHKPEDYYQIIEYVNSLDLGYRFYLDHFTIHQEETVLFAVVK